MTKLLFWAVGIVLLIAASVALADEPPRSLYERVTTTSVLVHQGTCSLPAKNLVDVLCLVYYNQKDELVWMVALDQVTGNMAVSHVVMMKEGHSVIAWCRQDVCL